ncbi:unnamed protein product [Pleuronectes platessa]|uniref:Uncharacterized protein n=1 Tax=Pleuronectes platessa TaxID=8262 RepID=A0A9N7U4R4_PLEPL|nr:unnamed protein product [Pleuronectes platessa]
MFLGFHANQGLVEGWLPTLLLLRDSNIPSFFTMYRRCTSSVAESYWFTHVSCLVSLLFTFLTSSPQTSVVVAHITPLLPYLNPPVANARLLEMELKYSMQILLELEMHIRDSGSNPFASQKPEQVQARPNKTPVHCNSHYICFQGLLPSEDFKELGPDN